MGIALPEMGYAARTMATKKRAAKKKPAATKKPKKAAPKRKPQPQKKKSAAKPKPKPKTKAKPSKPKAWKPLAGVPLATPEQFEKALDLLCDFVVRELPACEGDEAREKEVLVRAIESFYDVREAADQERGEYAGHFYMVDGVGLDDSDREVAFNRLREIADAVTIVRWERLFDEAERAAR